VIFYIINVYHIVGSGTFTLPSFLVMFGIFAGVLIVMYITWSLLVPIDWSAPLIEFGGSSQNDIFGF